MTARQSKNLCMQIAAREDVEVPAHLISDEEINRLMEERQPHYLPMGSDPAPQPSLQDAAQPSDSPAEGILQFRLSNGIRINARRTLNEPKAAMLRMVAAGQPILYMAMSWRDHSTPEPA